RDGSPGTHVWRYHYLYAANNQQGIGYTEAQVGNDCIGQQCIRETHQHPDENVGATREAWEAQVRYIQWMVDALHGYDNVMYEIANESPGSAYWIGKVMQIVRSRERDMGYTQRPIVLSCFDEACYQANSLTALMNVADSNLG